MTVRQALSKNLKLLISRETLKKNISITEFCRRNRICKSKLYSWMNMETIPSLENAYKLSVIFHCSVDDLIKGVDPDGNQCQTII